MIFDKTKFSISKKFWQHICIFECLLPQNPTNQSSNYLDSSRTYIRLLGDPKTGCLRELFVPENGFKTCSAAHFPKEHPKFGGWPGNQSKTKFKLEFFPHDLLLINSI